MSDGTMDRLREQAEVLRSREALGRSQALENLFRFLLACALEGRSPKEVEIADEVFGRTAANADQDASIRVHVHRLRRKLDQFYAGPGAGEAFRLVIPKGAYRLSVEPMVQAELPEAVGITRAERRRHFLPVAAAVLLVAIALSGWWLLGRSDPLQTVRANRLWQPAVSGERRVAIVLGDYYIFGERDAAGDVGRLVREFNVNSPKDLERLVASDPGHAGNYVDIGLNYLPVGVGNALAAIMPVLGRNDHSIVIPASQLSPEMVKNMDIVYLGYLSGLGSLRDPMFGGSRFAVGGSYDEIVDRQTGRTYLAGTHLDRNDENPNQDYALISRFQGVTGNAIVVIAGTRDAALMQAADFATRPEALEQIMAPLKGSTSFEALLAVESLHNVGLRARLIAAAPRKIDADWSGKHLQAFPDDFSNPTVAPPAQGR